MCSNKRRSLIDARRFEARVQTNAGGVNKKFYVHIIKGFHTATKRELREVVGEQVLKCLWVRHICGPQGSKCGWPARPNRFRSLWKNTNLELLTSSFVLYI